MKKNPKKKKITKKTEKKRRRFNMMSSIPIDLKKVEKADVSKEIVRIGMIAELDAVNLYEQLAAMTDDNDIREVLMDIAKEEKTHMGEFQALLLRNDKQQVEELKKGKDEVDKTTK
jgi:rubrerythrin